MSSQDPLTYIFHHVALPSKLPQSNDYNTAYEHELVQKLLKCAHQLRKLQVEARNRTVWVRLCQSLEAFASLHQQGCPGKNTLKTFLANLQVEDHFALYVAAQNAGLIFQRVSEDEVTVEAFEASPPSTEVLAAKGPLRWNFPHCAVTLPFDTLCESSFLDHLAEHLEKLSGESVTQFAATSLKANSFAIETRDTVNPSLVLDQIMTLLEANGKVETPVILQKNVRDDVCWTNASRNPWRRSPTWLILRVAIQRALVLSLEEVEGLLIYKLFMSVFLSALLGEMCSSANISPDSLHFVKAKTARRLFKLENRRDLYPSMELNTFDQLFVSHRKALKQSLDSAQTRLETMWAEIRRSSRKRIPRLLERATEQDTQLHLRNSRQHITRVLQTRVADSRAAVSDQTANVHLLQESLEKQIFVSDTDLQDIIDLSQFEKWVFEDLPNFVISKGPLDICKGVAKRLDHYMENAKTAYHGCPEQNSIMILTALELWISVDRAVIEAIPLLSEYRPLFTVGTLESLQLSNVEDLRRLQAAERYLTIRLMESNVSLLSIFAEPSPTCFAARFFDQSNAMQKKYASIVEHGEKLRDAKKKEWQAKMQEYELVSEQMIQKTCLMTEDPETPGKIIHDDKCGRCYLQRKLRRMTITSFEYPLPPEQAQAKSVVFELMAPMEFIIYRDTTWKIGTELFLAKATRNSDPAVLLYEYSQLKDFQDRQKPSLTLASQKKSFLESHYNTNRLPVLFDKVCLRNPLQFTLWDSKKHQWIAPIFSERSQPSCTHLCTLAPPYGSSWGQATLMKLLSPTETGPTSNESVASQSRCSSEVSVHEYYAACGLRAYRPLQWPTLLRELASVDLSFSSEVTYLLIQQLSLQVGPADGTNLARTYHGHLVDAEFGQRIIEQIVDRLNLISHNWREFLQADSLITILLQTSIIAQSEVVIAAATKALQQARAITLDWVRALKIEIYGASDTSTYQRRSNDLFLAALLCRRTFRLEARNEELLSSGALACYIECSIMLHDNKRTAGDSKTQLVRNAYLRDMKLAGQIQDQVYRSLLARPLSLTTAINEVWPGTDEILSLQNTIWGFDGPIPHRWVLARTVPIGGETIQLWSYDLVEGKLLINGCAMNTLPEQYTKAKTFQDLFGQRAYVVYPSQVSGMTHMLASPVEGNEIHVGFRNGLMVVRTRKGATMHELLPPDIFWDSSGGAPDLPMPLIGGHTHWIELRTGVVEIRTMASPFRSKMSDWKLHFSPVDSFTPSRAWRRESQLVEPSSDAFEHIAQILTPFEERSQLLVFQPPNTGLSVSMPRLEMNFFVNRRGFLQSRELNAEVDDNQDIGCLYGLESKLVLRDSLNHRERSFLVPAVRRAAPMTVARKGNHVSVLVKPSGIWCRFIINDLLKRIEPPIEPRFIYLKALLHAVTSFVLPDPFSGTTGTEEALNCLKSGYSQPWAPLTDVESRHVLTILADMTPKRSYYPDTMKVMQTTLWRSEFSASAQHDDYAAVVQGILQQSSMLETFSPGLSKPREPITKIDDHLTQRARWKNSLYRRTELIVVAPVNRASVAYETRTSLTAATRRAKVFEAASLIRKWSYHISTPPNLVELFQRWPSISGFTADFDRTLITDLINVDLAENWGPLFRLCRKFIETDRYRLMFLFALLTFNEEIDMMLVRALIALTIKAAESVRLTLPEWPSFTNFRQNQTPSIGDLVPLMYPAILPYPGDDRDVLGDQLNNKFRRKLEAAQKKHEKQAEDGCKVIAKKLVDQWPCLRPTLPDLDKEALLNVEQAVSIVQEEWEVLFKNYELQNHLLDVQEILNTCKPQQQFESQRAFRPVRSPDHNHLTIACDAPNLSFLLSRACIDRAASTSIPALQGEISSNQPNALATLPNGVNRRLGTSGQRLAAGAFPSAVFGQETNTIPVPPVDQWYAHQANKIDTNFIYKREPEMEAGTGELRSIISAFAGSSNAARRRYGLDLLNSLEALEAVQAVKKAGLPKANAEQAPVTADVIAQQARTVSHLFAQICSSLLAVPGFESPWLDAGDLWPRMTPVSILACVRSMANIRFGSGVYDKIIDYGMGITSLQRFRRIDARRSSNAASADDICDVGHQTWRPRDYPDWLLLEIESNILIRPDQVKVALATICPPSGSNSVLQMNMGQGKTSCIIPLAAAVLADASSLLRVIVPRPLLLQMAVILQQRLGGLLGRSIKHVPFSRRTPTDAATIGVYQEIHQQMLAERGIMLALPDHVLSFKLSGLQRLLDGFNEEAHRLIEVQRWLEGKARDILDECDHTLAVRTQLIYPSGSQKPVDGHPNRWKTSQALLQLIKEEIGYIAKKFPQGVDVEHRPGNGFPIIHFLRKTAEDGLIDRLIELICTGTSSVLPMQDTTTQRRAAVDKLLRKKKIARKDVAQILQQFSNEVALQQDLLLLRGLLVHRILLMVLKKRWNVQYGLHPNRDPVAVPYLAKGVPSEQAEFGHVDVSLNLTCLSFYFTGLGHDQLRQSLEHLLKSDDPDTEYIRWTQQVEGFPQSLRHWNSINLEDLGQLNDLWTLSRYNMVTINHYLNNFVFPRHAKVFERSLRQSAWDLPLFASAPGPPTTNTRVSKSFHSNAIPSRASLTTGFSGTNDNQYMLPFTIRQEDLPELVHTNAEVLTYLLQKRNRDYLYAADGSGKRLSEQGLLHLLHRNSKIRILIDAGAQILEMTNLELVAAWSLIDSEPPAAVYFGSDDKLWVRHRDGKTLPLIASPYANNVEKCLVYLDEAHCRGTDLKLPKYAVGALTLGSSQTKDATVQAAMRLRQLGSTQSIVWVSPPEVHQRILDVADKKSGAIIDSNDVIRWLLEQTCSEIEQLQPLLFSQGLDFAKRIQAALDNARILLDDAHASRFLSIIQQKEQYDLEYLYGLKGKIKGANTALVFSNTTLAEYNKSLVKLRADFEDTGDAVEALAHQVVEQEREVAFEVELVQQIERPTHATALVHRRLDPDLKLFALHGRLPANSHGYEPAAIAWRRTALGRKSVIRSDCFNSKLYVSTDFASTIRLMQDQPNDNYQRPVNWILVCPASETFVIISPHEAALLVPMLRQNKSPQTYLAIYAASVARSMLPLRDLSFYTIPSLPEGWTASRDVILDIAIFAGCVYLSFDESEALSLCFNGSSSEPDRVNRQPPFGERSIAFMQEWLAVRRKGQEYTHTPLGYILQSRRLLRDHPFFKNPVEEPIEETIASNADAGEPRDDATDEADADRFDEAMSDASEHDDGS